MSSDTPRSLPACADHACWVPRCVACDDVIGVYEPIVHLVAGDPRQTSRAAKPGPPEGLTGPLWHRHCWPGQ